ncbi:aldo/keto reductase [Methylovirgula sp. 4M-Z18]|uniref:aldo/keto reductase n=1 Tax=Methylovirgula sp. 4M-Z18 TaxID=2293567 RepID=UPI000E2FD9A4|nr:aldo/keto reductase [Methylovirgula sp. 4M-Z18]RFB75678.1 aldo/keto reductase [Methylovirgula sp. 4M-Z18]
MTTVPTTKLPDGSTMPVFGLGTWNMGEAASAAAAEVAALRAGLDLGVTLIDTAEMYGSGGAERVVGEAIAGRRDQAYLVSKVLPSNAGHRQTIRACEGSLKRLGTDRLDLYLLHWRGGTPLAETIAAFEDLQRDGKILRWGVSNFDVDDLREMETLSAGCQANQVLYNLARRGIEYDLIGMCQERSMPIMAYSPIEQGALTRDKVLEAIARDHDATPAQIALAWVLERPGVIAIPKTSHPARVAENLGALAVRLTDADKAKLDAAFPPPRRKRGLEMI